MWHYRWQCRCCGITRSHAENSTTSNLVKHIRNKKDSEACSHRYKPKNPVVRPYSEEADTYVDQDPADAGRDTRESAVIASSRSRMQDWRQSVRELTAAKQTLVQRRATLVWMVMTAQPFIATSNDYFRQMVAALNPTLGLDALKSARTMIRDLQLLHESLFGQAMSDIKAGPARFCLQHDTWTTPNRREAFLAVHVSWVDDSWQTRSACIAFERLGAEHTGATFAGHLAGILDRNQLWDRWSGLIVSDAAESNVRAVRFLQREISKDDRTLSAETRGRLLPFSIGHNLVLCFAHGLNRAVVDATAAAGMPTAMLNRDEAKIIRPAIFLDATDVGGSLEMIEPGDQSAQAEGPGADAGSIQAEYVALQSEVDELMLELETGSDAEDGPGDDGGSTTDFDDSIEAAMLLDDYRAEPKSSGEGPIARLHECLKKIRSSSKRIKEFEEVIASSYLGEPTGHRLPTLRGATRWNSFLREVRGCIKIQKAFTMWINSDESDTWTKYKLRQSEWLALAQLCDVLECAETVTLDVQQASSSIADVLFFHRVLRVSLSKQLAKLDNIAANDPAQCLKQAIKAMQLKLSKYERKASANTTIVTASLLHPQHRSKPLAQPPDGESPAALLRSMCDRFVGQVTPATAAPAQGTASKSKYSKYYEDEDEDDIHVASTSTTATTDEVDLYFSDRYPWMESLESHSTKGALAWWKQHTSFFPRLSRLAQTLLAVPSSTAITERGFSHAGIFCSPRRNLGPNSITMLTSSKLLILSGFDPHTASQQDVIPNPPRTSLVTGAATQHGIVTPVQTTPAQFSGISNFSTALQDGGSTQGPR